MSEPMTPVRAAMAFAAGDIQALRHIPLTATDGRAHLADMDGLPLVPSRTWSGYHHSVWYLAGLVEIDAKNSRFRLTDVGRRACSQVGVSA